MAGPLEPPSLWSCPRRPGGPAQDHPEESFPEDLSSERPYRHMCLREQLGSSLASLLWIPGQGVCGTLRLPEWLSAS